MAQRLKRLPTMWETWVRSLGQEDPLEKEMATHSSILAWKIPWRSLAGYSPRDRKESDTTERLHFLSLSLRVKKELRLSLANWVNDCEFHQRKRKPVWRENDKMASAHNDFEILMKYPSRAVQKIGENPASYSLNILFSFFSPNKSQLCLGQ